MVFTFKIITLLNLNNINPNPLVNDGDTFYKFKFQFTGIKIINFYCQ